MKTKQLLVQSAVTVVATGLTLLSSGTTQASDRRLSGMRMGGAGGGMNNGAFHQSTANRAISRGGGVNDMVGRNKIDNRAMNLRRDDRGGRRERERGDDRGRGRDNSAMTTAREREPGDDHGHHRERGDDKRRGEKAATTAAREREPGDDHGRHRERGDDRGGR